MIVDFLQLFYALTTVVVLVLCYCIFLVPVNWKDKDANDKKSAVNRARRLRKIGSKLPPPFPNGWYRLATSKEIKPGTAKHFDCIGEHFVVFRSSESMKIFVLDAYCPHMGASLGVGGLVKGDCIECPFHKWKFNGENGALVDIPYSENLAEVEKFAKIRKWTSREVNGCIFVWYHQENEEPWEIPVIEEIENGEYSFHGSNEFHVHSHIQDIPENGADIAHLAAVHGPSILAGMDISNTHNSWLSIGLHIWNAKWSANESHKHMATVKLTHVLNILSFKFIEINADIDQIGPGIVILKLNLCFGKIVIIQTLTPLEPLVQSLSHYFYAPWYLGWLSKFIMFGETINVARDVQIWNFKEFLKNPLLPKEEKPLKLYRKWFSQFYSENSKSFAHAHDTLSW